MASTSSFLGDYASSSLVVAKRYDVFISFRGEDTRSDFTSHLHAALRRNNIDTYIDYSFQKGEQVWLELLKAIKDSTLFLVIFSENYASSSWCLNELVELMECKKQEQDHVHVIPVFYKVDPSQVRKQEGCYHVAFEEHKKDGKVCEEKKQQWKNALYKAANLSGFHSKILEIIKERKDSDKGDPKLTFKFFTETRYDKEAVIIKECGFRWIYSVEEEGCKSNRSGEGSESSDQEETLPPVNSGTSNMKAEEIEELRSRLEKLSLHSI